MSNLLIAIAVFVITLLAALFAIPYAIDWNSYRGVFEEEASRMLGREVRVGGAVNMHFLPTPYVSLERVRIADAAGGLQEPFFRTESVTIKLAVPPLLRGAIEAHEVEFRRPVLRIAVDDKGNWNWQSFIGAFKDAAYMPSNVAITSLVISDGMLALHSPNGQERTRYEGIGAELSAPALEGPYRMRATYGSGGAGRELRLATAAPEADGSVRIKTSLRAQDTASTYSIDAKVANLMGNVRLEGELTARLPFGGLWPTQSRAATDEAFELKSMLVADGNGMQMRDLALGFEQGGQPQSLAGEVTAQWRNTLDVDVRLTSSWLDLDRISGVGATAGPLDSIVPFAKRLRDLLPHEGRSRASLVVEQANVGREAISGLKLALAKTNDRVVIDELRAGVPGGARIEITGALSGSPEEPGFLGAINLRGASLARFAGWASAGVLASEGRADGTFGLRASLAIAPGFASLRNIAAEISGNAVQGSASYRWGAHSEIAVRLDGPQIDARALIPAGADLSQLAAALAPGGGEQSAAGGALAAADLSLRVSTGVLLTAGTTYRDVAVEIERKGGTLRIPRLRLSGEDDFSLDLEGEIAMGGAQRKGTLRLVAAAETAAALGPLAELIGIPEAVRPGEARFQTLAPLRLAGTVALGARGPTSLDITGDGESNGGNLRIAARLDGGAKGWRSGPADILVSIENPDAQQVAALLLPGTGSVASTGAVVRPQAAEAGRLLLRAAGVPADGMATLFSLTANETAVAFDGRYKASAEAPQLAGDIEIAGADGSRIAALAKLSPPLRLGRFPVNGTLRIATDGSTVNIERLALDVGGGVKLKGRLGIAPEGAGQRISAELETESLNLAQLLAPALDNRIGAAAAAAESALSGRASAFPAEPFDTRAVRALAGDIKLKAQRIDLDKGLTLADAQADVNIGDGRITVRQLEGTALGARWAAAFTLAAQPQGMELNGTLSTERIALEQAAGGGSGTARVRASFQGRGASPRAIIAALQGQASVDLANAALAGPSPAAVSRAVEAGTANASDSIAQLVRQSLTTHLGMTALALPQTLSVDIADGIARFKPVTIDTAEGSADGTASIDLGALTFSSDWRLTDKVLSGKGRQLPPVTISYRGSLAAVGQTQPEIGIDALEREIAVRKMERDVDELERLRRLDEARRREDSERLREQIERAPPPEPSAAQPAPPPQPRPQAQQQKAPSLKSLLPSWLIP
ncbi:MAG: AsmA family protein [Hyphomicrobiaceae bacterium]|nr:AsmA family protein [Hyphomicrobiaceae bacterium]